MIRLPVSWFMGVALAMGFSSGPAAGQTRTELRVGLAVGSHTATAAGLERAPKLAYEALVLRRVTPRFSVYGGYARTAFGCREGFCLDRDLTVVGNHAVLGGEARAGWAWLRLGLLLGTTEVGDEGDPPDMGPGIHAGFGFILQRGRWSLSPGLTYRWLSANTPSSSEHAAALAADLGVGLLLGGRDPGG